MNPNLDQAIAAAREALAKYDRAELVDELIPCAAHSSEALRDLLAALDAARGEAVLEVVGGKDGWRGAWAHKPLSEFEVGTKLFAAPPADDALVDTQRSIIEAAERRGYERGLKEREDAMAVPEPPEGWPVGPAARAMWAAAQQPAAAVPDWAGHVKAAVDIINAAKSRPFTVSEKAELLMLASMLAAANKENTRE